MCLTLFALFQVCVSSCILMALLNGVLGEYCIVFQKKNIGARTCAIFPHTARFESEFPVTVLVWVKCVARAPPFLIIRLKFKSVFGRELTSEGFNASNYRFIAC
jgi:hypothetical protein